jgi:hypothetical protein
MQPRGYAGDAELLDYIYGFKRSADASMVGSKVFAYSTNGHASQAVRERRDLLARLIDQTIQERDKTRIVSLACGHLREVQKSTGLAGGRVHEFVALDQDIQSVAFVRSTFAHLPVRTLHASIRSLLAGRILIKEVDFAYAAGLFDYLADRTAAHLIQVMFDMLSSGGRMLIANFSPALRDIGYMDAFMRWRLIYRNSQEVERLSEKIPEQAIRSRRVFHDNNKCMVFMEIVRN